MTVYIGWGHWVGPYWVRLRWRERGRGVRGGETGGRKKKIRRKSELHSAVHNNKIHTMQHYTNAMQGKTTQYNTMLKMYGARQTAAI